MISPPPSCSSLLKRDAWLVSPYIQLLPLGKETWFHYAPGKHQWYFHHACNLKCDFRLQFFYRWCHCSWLLCWQWCCDWGGRYCICVVFCRVMASITLIVYKHTKYLRISTKLAFEVVCWARNLRSWIRGSTNLQATLFSCPNLLLSILGARTEWVRTQVVIITVLVMTIVMWSMMDGDDVDNEICDRLRSDHTISTQLIHISTNLLLD